MQFEDNMVGKTNSCESDVIEELKVKERKKEKKKLFLFLFLSIDILLLTLSKSCINGRTK